MASLKSFLPSWLHLSTFFDCYICNKSFSYRNKIVCSVFQWRLVLHRWGGIRQTWPQTPPPLVQPTSPPPHPNPSPVPRAHHTHTPPTHGHRHACLLACQVPGQSCTYPMQVIAAVAASPLCLLRVPAVASLPGQSGFQTADQWGPRTQPQGRASWLAGRRNRKTLVNINSLKSHNNV